MNDTPIQIRNPEVVRDIRALADRLALPITEVVADAVRRRLAEEIAKDRAAVEARRRKIAAALASIDRLPQVGPPLTDAELYDDDGLPR